MKYIGSGQQSDPLDMRTSRGPASGSYIEMTWGDDQMDVYRYFAQQCMMSFTMNLS
jgi:hypothetical protein